VVAKVEHHAGELFPRLGIIATNMTLPSRAVVGFYNERGTSEQWIKEGKQVVKMTRWSCHRFRSNDVSVSRRMAERDRLQLGQPGAAAGATDEGRQLVSDEPAAAVGEDRRPVGQARPVLLAALGREPSDQMILRGHGPADWFAVHARGGGEPPNDGSQ
jgi:hypothetical protein